MNPYENLLMVRVKMAEMHELQPAAARSDKPRRSLRTLLAFRRADRAAATAPEPMPNRLPTCRAEVSRSAL